ncbi:hypothetical protein VDIAB_100809 [Vibrio diabolicus]|nr:hypothetical protein VDIAB_100809 [Vibrio diabolicus]
MTYMGRLQTLDYEIPESMQKRLAGNRQLTGSNNARTHHINHAYPPRSYRSQHIQ